MADDGSSFFDEDVDYSTDRPEETLDARSDVSRGDDDDDDNGGTSTPEPAPGTGSQPPSDEPFAGPGGQTGGPEPTPPEPEPQPAPPPEPAPGVGSQPPSDEPFSGPSGQRPGGTPSGEGPDRQTSQPADDDGGGGGTGPTTQPTPPPGAPAPSAGGQGIETRTGEQETVRVSDPRSVFGQQTDPVATEGTVARNIEQRWLERNPQYSEEDVAVRRTDKGFQTELTAEGEARSEELAAAEFEQRFEQQLGGVDIAREDIEVQRTDSGYTGQLAEGALAGLTAEEQRTAAVATAADPYRQEDLRQEAARAEAGETSFFTPAAGIDPYRREDLQQEAARAQERRSSLYTPPDEEEQRRRQQAAQTTDATGGLDLGGLEPASPEARREEILADDEITDQELQDYFGDRQLYGRGTDTETVGAAGPLGVTVPSDSPAATSERSPTSRATEDWLRETFITIQEGTGTAEPGEPVAVPAGAPGAGNLVTEPVSRADVERDTDAITGFMGDIATQLTSPVTGPEGPRAVPEGAPGPGVMVDSGTREDLDRFLGGFGDAVARIEAPTDFEAGTPPERQESDRPAVDEATETIGATGPLSVSVPEESAPATGGRSPSTAAVVAAVSGIGPHSVDRGTGEFEGPVDVPAGAPGVGVGAGTGDPRFDAGQVVATVERALAPGAPASRRSSQVDVPEGAPGPGVMVDSGTREDFETFQQRVVESISPTEPVDTAPPADSRPVVGAAGPMGVTAPQDQLDAADVRRGAETAAAVATEALERPARGDGDAFTGGTIAGGLVQPGDREETVGVVMDTAPEGDVGAALEDTGERLRSSAAETVTAGGAAVSAPAEDAFRQRLRRGETEPVAEGVEDYVGDVIVTESEAAEMNLPEEEFGDREWVVGGVDVEATAFESSREFRKTTEDFAENATAAAGLPQDSAVDTTAETFLTTFPEIFNVGGLTRDAMEIYELGEFTAARPRERVPEVAEAGQQRAELLVDYYSENRAQAAGAFLALGAQVPTSLATLRGVSSVSRTAGRGLDVMWNTPERVARRTIGRTDTDAFAEVRMFGSELSDRVPTPSRTRTGAEARGAPSYEFLPFASQFADRATDLARRTTVRARPGMFAGGFEIEIEPETETGDVADLPTEIAGTDPTDVRPGRLAEQPETDIGGFDRRRSRRRRGEAQDDAYDAWRRAREEALARGEVDIPSGPRPRIGAGESQLITAEVDAGVATAERDRTETVQQPFWATTGQQSPRTVAPADDVLTPESRATTAGTGALLTGLGMETLDVDFRTQADTRGATLLGVETDTDTSVIPETGLGSETDLGIETAAETDQELGVEVDQEVGQELEQELEQELGQELEQQLEQEQEQEQESEPEPEFEWEPEPEPFPDFFPDEEPQQRRESPGQFGIAITNPVASASEIFGMSSPEASERARGGDGESPFDIIAQPDGDDQPAIQFLGDAEESTFDDALEDYTGGVTAAASGSGRGAMESAFAAFFGGQDTDGPSRGEQEAAEGARSAMASLAERFFGAPEQRRAQPQQPAQGGQAGVAPALQAFMGQSMGMGGDGRSASSQPAQQPPQAAGGLGAFMAQMGQAQQGQPQAPQPSTPPADQGGAGDALRAFMGGMGSPDGSRQQQSGNQPANPMAAFAANTGGQDLMGGFQFDFEFDFGLQQ